jgi:putative glutamine amidotransferase
MSSCAVGICAAIERAQWDPWDELVFMTPRAYATAVQDAGALALVLPPDDAVAMAADSILDRVDALLLAGGCDIDPGTYGAKPHPETAGTRPERDRFELALTHRALERDVPVLGICRGMQLMNVALGGTLVQHLPDVLGTSEHRKMPGIFGDHDVRLEAGSLAARAVGEEKATVKSHHHQGLDELGEGLRATGWSVSDDLIEAVELADRRFALGVLWHPEVDEPSRVVTALVEAARSEVGAR